MVYDTLLKSPPERIKSIVAHELGHAKHNDVLRGTLTGALGVSGGVCLLYLALTSPGLRRRGVATAGMAACCALALERFPVLSLYVNDFNAPAVALYERLGFTRAPYDFQTVLLA